MSGSVSGLFGTASITNSIIDGFNESGMEVRNFSGTLSLTITDTQFSNNQSTVGNFGEEGILLSPEGTAVMTVLIESTDGSSCLFDTIQTQGVDATPGGTATINLTIDDCVFDDIDAGDGAIKVDTDVGSNANVTIKDNSRGGANR